MRFGTWTAQVQSHLQEHLQHRILIRTLEYTSRAVGKTGVVSVGFAAEGSWNVRIFPSFHARWCKLGFAVGYAVAFLWGIFGLRDGSVTFGMMTAFLQLVAQVQRPMVDISRQIPSFIRVFTSAERLAELQALPLERQGVSVRLDGCLGIRAEGVSFAYPGNERRVLG